MTIPPLTACHLCGWPHLTRVLDLGTMALTGVFPRPGQDVPEGPLEVVTCDACGLAQLGHVYPLHELYGAHYGYRSGLNPTMVAHLRSIAEDAWRLAAPEPGDFVVDLGSNDGTFINLYPDSVTRIAFDPLLPKYAEHYRTGVEPFPEFFTPASALKVPQGRAAIVTSIACFYDLPDPVGTARAIARLLKPGGIWVVEVADLDAMIRNMAFDQIVQEHVEYYRGGDILGMARRAGLSYVRDVQNDINGGSCRFVFRKGGLDIPEFTIERVIDWPAFQHRIDRACVALRQFLEDEHDSGRTVWGYGASTKGNVVLQRAAITPDLLPLILDANPDKDGCETPGTHIPIRFEDRPLVAVPGRPETVLVLPWHFRDFIIQKEREFLRQGGRLVFALPTLEVVTKDALKEVA